MINDIAMLYTYHTHAHRQEEREREREKKRQTVVSKRQIDWNCIHIFSLYWLPPGQVLSNTVRQVDRPAQGQTQSTAREGMPRQTASETNNGTREHPACSGIFVSVRGFSFHFVHKVYWITHITQRTHSTHTAHAHTAHSHTLHTHVRCPDNRKRQKFCKLLATSSQHLKPTTIIIIYFRMPKDVNKNTLFPSYSPFCSPSLPSCLLRNKLLK